MKTNSAHLRWACTLLAVLLLAATLSACNGTEETSEETARSASAPTQKPAPPQTSEPTQTPEPTEAPAPTETAEPTQTLEPTQTPEPVPESGGMSLDEYAAFCADFDSGETTEEEGEITYGEFSDGLAVLIGLLESVNPPQEVSEWHEALLTNQRELKSAIDEYTGSKDDPIDIEKFFALIVSYHEGLSETLRAMDPALRDWLVAAGCIDEEMAAAASAWLDESIEADEEIVRRELAVGTGIEVPVDEASETDHFFFRAEEGKTYLIETVWEGLSSIRIELTDGRTFWKVRERNRQPLQFTWTASEPGQYRLNVISRSSSEGGTGSYILGVSFDDQTAMPAAPATPAPAAARVASPTPMPTAGPAASPEPTVTPAPAEAALTAPADVRYAFEGTAIRINWETVEGADHYILYHDDFFDSSCSLREDGSPSFCEELAVDVVDTTYLHTDPNAAKNYYWVVACNQEGCSQIDSGTPAVPIVGRPVSPPAVTFAREGAAIRISWDIVEGADYYKVYHDAFFGSGCSLGPDGRPSFCQELATNVVEPGYVHTAPGEDRNFYWVVACNRGGCSEIVSEDPAREG